MERRNGTRAKQAGNGKAVLRLSNLRHLPIVDLSMAKRVGTIEEVQVDTATGRVAALDVRLKDGSATERIPSARARRIGHHAVVIEGGAEFVPMSMGDDRWLESEALLGLEVLGDDGDRVGHISDVYVNRDTLAVEAYELRASVWQRAVGRPRLIMPDQVLASSHELMLIPAAREADATSWDETTMMVPLRPRGAEGAVELEAKSA